MPWLIAKAFLLVTSMCDMASIVAINDSENCTYYQKPHVTKISCNFT